jgi:hypothetical protein
MFFNRKKPFTGNKSRQKSRLISNSKVLAEILTCRPDGVIVD